MRISHISDTHGSIPGIMNCDVIVHTGDMFPNSYFSTIKFTSKEIEFQIEWLEKNIKDFKEVIQNRDFLFVLGNHDFVDDKTVEAIFKKNKIKAKSLHEEIVTYKGYNFYGFPYIPEIGRAHV